MELTDKHFEMINEAVREIDYGSVTINIFSNSKFDLIVQKRIRIEDDQNVTTMGVDVQKDGVLCSVAKCKKKT